MDAEEILVSVLCAGGLALLVWFEINSRRNAARKKQGLSSAQADVAGVARDVTSKAHSEVDKTKAA